MLISNGLRFIFTYPLFLALPILLHVTHLSFATMMLTLGADLYTTSKLPGHSNVKTTQIYAKIVDTLRHFKSKVTLQAKL